MVEYLDGGRIQGSSIGGLVTPTYPSSGTLPTGSTTTDWTLADATISSSNINFNSGQQGTDNRAMYDLGANVSDTKWTLRFKYDISDWASGSNSNIGGFTGIFSSSGNNGATQDGIYLGFYTDSSRNYFVAGAINNGGFEGYTTNSAYYLDTTPSETTYYVEIKRTGASSGEITLYSDSTYETKIGTTHTSFLNGISSSISGLRYVGIKNRYDVPTLGTARWEGTISNIQIWNDITTVTTDEKTSLSNVPDGTRYEETDTRKIYSFNSNAPWTSTNWTERGDTPSGAFRGVFGGGSLSSSQVNTMDYVTISTLGNASDFGDLTVTRSLLAGVFDATRGVFCGGRGGSTYYNTLDYVTIGTTGNATDFGDNNTDNAYMAGCSSDVRGCYGGGWR